MTGVRAFVKEFFSFLGPKATPPQLPATPKDPEAAIKSAALQKLHKKVKRDGTPSSSEHRVPSEKTFEAPIAVIVECKEHSLDIGRFHIRTIDKDETVYAQGDQFWNWTEMYITEAGKTVCTASKARTMGGQDQWGVIEGQLPLDLQHL